MVRTGWDITDELDCTSIFGPFKTMATRAKREGGTDSSWHYASNEPLNWF